MKIDRNLFVYQPVQITLENPVDHDALRLALQLALTVVYEKGGVTALNPSQRSLITSLELQLA